MWPYRALSSTVVLRKRFGSGSRMQLTEMTTLYLYIVWKRCVHDQLCTERPRASRTRFSTLVCLCSDYSTLEVTAVSLSLPCSIVSKLNGLNF